MKTWLIAFLFLLAAAPALADHGIGYEDLGGEPRLLPDHPLYVLKEWRYDLRRLLASSAQKPAVDFDIANRRLADIKKLATERPEAVEALARAEERYREHFARLETHFADLSDANPNTERLMRQFNDIASRHLLVFEEVRERAGERTEEERKTNAAFRKLTDKIFAAHPEGRVRHLLDQLEHLYEEKIGVPPPDSSGLACIQIYDPVCGVDNVTYSNSCFAGLAGVKVKQKGECSK